MQKRRLPPPPSKWLLGFRKISGLLSKLTRVGIRPSFPYSQYKIWNQQRKVENAFKILLHTITYICIEGSFMHQHMLDNQLCLGLDCSPTIICILALWCYMEEEKLLKTLFLNLNFFIFIQNPGYFIIWTHIDEFVLKFKVLGLETYTILFCFPSLFMEKN